MGQPVTVIEKPSVNPGIIRFETNRALTGMGHEMFRSLDDVKADRPADVIARTLFERGGIESVHVNANVITVQVSSVTAAEGLKDVIEQIFLFYREGDEAPAEG